jgi:hypothetical protein
MELAVTDQPETPPEGAIPAAHIVEGVARSISKDGTTAMMVFKIADGSQFAVTVPLPGLSALRTMVNDLCDAADKSKLGRGMVTMKRPHTFTIGHSDQMRGHVLMQIDPQMAEEIIFIWPDEAGLQMADLLQKDIFGRMSPADRAARAKNQKPFLMPQRTLIVPPRVR